MIATDLKLCNVLLGMMNHSSNHPCAWCDIKKDMLHKKGNQRTIGGLMDLFFDFFDSQKEKKRSIEFLKRYSPPFNRLQ